MEIKKRERNEIDSKYKWDLSLIYKSIEDFNNDYDIVIDKINNYLKYKNKLKYNANTLLEALKEKDEIVLQLEKLSSYASRISDEDLRNSDNLKLKNKIISLEAKHAKNISFLVPEILKIGSSKINEYFKEEKELEIYKQYLNDILRYKKHTLSNDKEMIIASASEILMLPYKTFTMLNSTGIKFEDIIHEDKNIPLTVSNYNLYVSSQNRDIRKKAFESLYKSYETLKYTFSENLIGNIKANYFISNNKKYNSPREMSLFNNNIDEIVYDNLIKVTHQNLDKLHKYVSMKKQVLKIDDFHMYDFYVDLIKEYDIEYSYEEAVDLVMKALEPLGEEYLNKAKKAFVERWIDVYENVGKRSGAYSSFGYDIPLYILLNYNGKFNSVSTLAHELGHSMHSYYAASNQPYIYHDYSIFLAEIASTVNEVLLNMYMLNKAKDKKEKMSFINNFLDSVKSTIYRQVMFAEFEKTIYELEGNNTTLTEEVISDLYYELNKKYYGNNIIHDEFIKYEWMRIPHFYYGFYVYQYATGLSIAYYIAKEIYNGNTNFRDKYLNMLASGSSKYPLELLKDLGIDMKNTEVINDIFNSFDNQIDEFIKLANE